MGLKIFENAVFGKEEVPDKKLIKGEYEKCTFKSCDFANADLSGLTFIDCTFEDCNLSMTLIRNASFKTVKFIGCKLLGLNFGECNDFLFSVNFENCTLNLASFYKLKLRGTKFIHCNLQEVDFTETDLTGADFDHCDLDRALFGRTNLEKTDFRTAYHYSIDPTVNRMKKARFSKDRLAGLLERFDIIAE